MSIDYFLQLLFLLSLGTVGAMVAIRLKVPNAVFIGPILFVGVYQVVFGSIMDKSNGLRLAVQIAVGIVLGTSITKDFLFNFKSLIKPILTVCLTLLGGGLALGMLLKNFAGWDLLTSLLAAAPGGQAEMALLSDSVGAQTEKVIMLQLIRSQLALVIMLPLAKLYLEKHHLKRLVSDGKLPPPDA